MTSKLDLSKLDYSSIDLDGIDTSDYPDFCDAYISYACWKDGTELTDSELDQLNDNSSLVYDLVIERLY